VASVGTLGGLIASVAAHMKFDIVLGLWPALTFALALAANADQTYPRVF
jgi:hypothetical protein